MRVLQIVPSIAARHGGPSEAAIQICRALVDQAVETTLAVTAGSDESEDYLAIARSMRSRQFEVVAFPRFLSRSLMYSPALAEWLRCETRKFDVVHVHAVFSHASMAGMSQAQRSGRPYILRPLGHLAPYSLARSSLKKQLFLRAGVRRLIESASSIHCTSVDERDEIMAAFRIRRSFVAPNGVDRSLFDVDDSGRENVVAFIGRLHPKKNIEKLIQAFCAAGPDAEGWRLAIAGDGDPGYVASLRTQAAHEPSISFPGWIDNRARIDLLRRASLFVLPSAHENFGIAAAEAMAAGVPVILSEDVNVSTYVRAFEGGWVVSPSVAELRGALGEALADAPELRRRGANARRVAEENFAWNRVALRLKCEYEEVLEPSLWRRSLTL